MSKKSDRAAAERRADALARDEHSAQMALFALDQKMDREAEQDRQVRREFLANARQELDKDREEAERIGLDNYRQQAIAAALSNQSLSPQVAAMIPVGLSSREDIDNFVQLGIDKTAEIVAEVAGQLAGPQPYQDRDERGRFILSDETQAADQIVIDKSLSMRDYITRVRPALNINAPRDNGIFG